MKTNKKAVLGMLVAMIMALGLMSGFNKKGADTTLQHWAVISYFAAQESETVTGKVVSKTVGGISGGAATSMIIAGVATAGIGLLVWGGVVAS